MLSEEKWEAMLWIIADLQAEVERLREALGRIEQSHYHNRECWPFRDGSARCGRLATHEVHTHARTALTPADGVRHDEKGELDGRGA